MPKEKGPSEVKPTSKAARASRPRSVEIGKWAAAPASMPWVTVERKVAWVLPGRAGNKEVIAKE